MTWQIVLLLLLLTCSRDDSDARTRGPLTQGTQDSVVTAVVPPEGGTVELRGVAQVIFPPQAFEAPELVRIWTTNFPGTEAGQMDYFLHGGGPPPQSRPFLANPARDVPPPALPYDIRISGDAAPATGFQVILTVPEAYLSSLPPDHTPQVFAKVETGGPSESHHTYSMMASGFDPGAQLVRAKVWTGAIWRDPDGGFVVTLLVAARPL